ncbi:MAG: hypothetical protein ACK465_02765 [Flavobacteriia bacterium]|jgi:hypothetical protein
MKNFFFYLATFISVTFWCTALNAQTPNTASPSSDTTKYLIIKNDGNEYVGLILSDDGREVLIETKSLGKIYIPKSDIKSMRPIDYAEDVAKGEFSSAGVFTTRYQFTTNCFPIKKGENYAMVNLYGPEVHFAVHKDFSVGVMSTWIGSPIALALKFTRGTSNPKINYGVGTLLGTSGYLNQGRGFGGLHWGMITYGDRRNNATLSVGYGYFNPGNNSWSPTVYVPGTYAAVGNGWWPDIPVDYSYQGLDKSSFIAPIIGLAGQAKVGKKASFIYDCMYIIGSEKSTYAQVNQTQTPQYDANGTLQQVVVSEWTETVFSTTNYQNLLVIMPGMRFQRSETKAFQISLAGVIVPNEVSFPLPMASWFYRF